MGSVKIFAVGRGNVFGYVGRELKKVGNHWVSGYSKVNDTVCFTVISKCSHSSVTVAMK